MINIDDLKERNIRLVVLDLDGTLLDSKKQVTEETLAVLQAAYERGIEIVPATGRFFDALPAVVKEMPFIHYAITINGSETLDLVKNISVASVGIPAAQAVEIMEYFDTLPVIYDCYMNNWGWMNREFIERFPKFIQNEFAAKFIARYRTPVDDLKEYIRKENPNGFVQNIQFFTKDPELRLRELEELPKRFENLSVTSASPDNVEMGHVNSNKGEALRKLAEYLGIDMSQTAAFGDGLNDLSMIRAAGLGVAMKNAEEKVLEAADFITLSNDEDGVAEVVKRL